MNARHSLFTISTMLLLLCPAAGAIAQNRFERVLNHNLYNDGLGVNGIRMDRISSAEAELSGAYQSGGFKSASDASSLWRAAASTRAIRHLDKFSLAGEFGFSQMQGKDMCGPMSIEPGCFPLEIWEFTPGRKTLQSYIVDGGISVSLNDSWNLGGRYRMNSRNYAKRKDLRHTNYRLDMEGAAGLQWHSDNFSIELDGILGKVAETIDAEQIGTAGTSYYAFLDKGLMYGAYELWSGSGIHLNETGVKGLPMKKGIYGLGLEFGYGDNAFASLQYRHSDGVAGEKEYILYRFPEDSFDAHLAARLKSHSLRLSFHASSLNNNETVLDVVTVGGITTVKEHGANRILSRTEWNISPSYEYAGELCSLRASLDFGQRNSTSSQMYPFCTDQKVRSIAAGLGGRYHGKKLELDLSLGYYSASVDETERSVDGTVADKGPQRYGEGYILMMEYMTIPRMSAAFEARWYPKGKGWNLALKSQITNSLKAVSAIEGRSRTETLLSIGTDF